MNCEKVKELLLTDYADNRLDAQDRAMVDEHIARCSVCRELQTMALTIAESLFDDDKNIQAPEYLWHRIKREIVSEKKVNKTWDFWTIFDVFKLIPKPALVLAALMIFVLANAVVTRYIFAPLPQVKTNEILGYLENVSDFGADSPGLNTDIEQFL
jgi:predicted anti-sigma-YlaC factor YlaD